MEHFIRYSFAQKKSLHAKFIYRLQWYYLRAYIAGCITYVRRSASLINFMYMKTIAHADHFCRPALIHDHVFCGTDSKFRPLSKDCGTYPSKEQYHVTKILANFSRGPRSKTHNIFSNLERKKGLKLSILSSNFIILGLKLGSILFQRIDKSGMIYFRLHASVM